MERLQAIRHLDKVLIPDMTEIIISYTGWLEPDIIYVPRPVFYDIVNGMLHIMAEELMGIIKIPCKRYDLCIDEKIYLEFLQSKGLDIGRSEKIYLKFRNYFEIGLSLNCERWVYRMQATDDIEELVKQFDINLISDCIDYCIFCKKID